MDDYEYLLSSLDKIKGIGKRTIQLFLDQADIDLAIIGEWDCH